VVLAVILSTLAPRVLAAHHGGAAFDQSKSVTLTGTVTELQFANPHVLVFFDVKNDQGQTTNWSGWLTAPNKLARAGWSKRTLKPGDAVSVTGSPHKDGVQVIQIRRLNGPDGKPLATAEE
jgi:hypothetical protein